MCSRNFLKIVAPGKKNRYFSKIARRLLLHYLNSVAQGVWGDGVFNNMEDLIKTLTTYTFILSCVHAAANFNQYDEYGFPPNMPFKLRGLPPKNKVEYGHQYI